MMLVTGTYIATPQRNSNSVRNSYKWEPTVFDDDNWPNHHTGPLFIHGTLMTKQHFASLLIHDELKKLTHHWSDWRDGVESCAWQILHFGLCNKGMDQKKTHAFVLISPLLFWSWSYAKPHQFLHCAWNLPSSYWPLQTVLQDCDLGSS